MNRDQDGILFSTPVSSPSTLNAARALYEAGVLSAYYTTAGLVADGPMLATARHIDQLLGSSIEPQLRRRAIEGIPGPLVRRFPWLDITRTLLSIAGCPQPWLVKVEAMALDDLDSHVARKVSDYPAVYAFRNGAEKTFAAAKRDGAYCIYGVKFLEYLSFKSVEQRELIAHPWLRSPGASLPEPEQEWPAKLRHEWDLADLVITNSQACLDSYRASGADVSKARAVPLAFPTPCDPALVEGKRAPEGPLRALWAGSFSLRKGAHYLLQALQSLDETQIETSVFGKQGLPQAALAAFPTSIKYHPTIPRRQLLGEYRRADVLVMPTLSDGFGMVISEAMSQGLPVITTNQAGAAQFIRSGENGLIIPAGDARALAEALTWCAGHREALREMGIKARLTAASWQWPDYRRELAAIVTAGLAQHANAAF